MADTLRAMNARRARRKAGKPVRLNRDRSATRAAFDADLRAMTQPDLDALGIQKPEPHDEIPDPDGWCGDIWEDLGGES